MNLRTCKICNEEKEEVLFEKHSEKIRNRCKECRNKTLRTGKPNKGRFQKGIIPKTAFKKGCISLNKGKYWGNSRSTKKNGIWKTAVKERDGYKCVKCGITERLECHHIKPWKTYPELRFEVSNGITLCKVCHGKEEGLLNANNGISTRFKKGHKHSEETRKKLSVSHLGQKSWNKGLKMSQEYRKKLSDAHIGQRAWNKGLKSDKPSPNKGKKVAEHVRQALIEANRKTWEKRKLEGLPGPRKGIKTSEETKKKLSDSLKKAYTEGIRIKKPMSEETKKKISDTKRNKKT